MTKWGLITIISLLLVGCVSVQHSEFIGTDHEGMASGIYRDNRSGTICNISIWGTGAGASAATSAASTAVGAAASPWMGNLAQNGGSGAFGAAGLHINPPPTQGNPLLFARSIAMINYSRRLLNIKYDDTGEIIKYEFSDKPLKKRKYQPFGQTSQNGLPEAFGRQPLN